jgi:hypothetical protein
MNRIFFEPYLWLWLLFAPVLLLAQSDGTNAVPSEPHEPTTLPGWAHQLEVGLSFGENWNGDGVTGFATEYTVSRLFGESIYLGATTGLNMPDPVARYMMIPLAVDFTWAAGVGERKHPWTFGVNSGYAWAARQPLVTNGSTSISGGWRLQLSVGRMFAAGGDTRVLFDVGYARQNTVQEFDLPWWGELNRREAITHNRYQFRFGVLF